jgi:hypothetical protein
MKVRRKLREQNRLLFPRKRVWFSAIRFLVH